MKLCLTILVLLSGLLPAAHPAFPIDLVRRKDPARVESARKDEAKDEKPRPEIEIVKNIAYRDDKYADPVRHKLDLYLPKSTRGFPVVFFVHGGSWKSGNKDEYPRLGELFANAGIGCVVINYRLSPKVQHPAHIEDVASAFAWTVANIEKYGGRKDRIFACGHSAGGHLVALLATDDRYLKKEGRSLKDIRGVIAISGVHQISPYFPMFRGVFGKDRDDCRAASPINHVHAGEPPFLLLYAEHDLPLLGHMSEEMSETLKKYKCDAECMKMQQRNHMSILLGLVHEADDSRQAIFEFIAKHSDWKAPPREEPKDESRRENRKKDSRKKDDK